MIGGHLPELMVLLGLALVVFGPKRLPDIAGSMGKGIRNFRTQVSGPNVDHAETQSKAELLAEQSHTAAPESA